MWRWLAVLAAGGAAGAPALAQPVCGERTAILDSLSHDFQETPAAVGRSNGGNIVEVYTARHGKTWTILVTRPDGNSCIIAAGQQWTALPQQLSATVDDGI